MTGSLNSSGPLKLAPVESSLSVNVLPVLDGFLNDLSQKKKNNSGRTG